MGAYVRKQRLFPVALSIRSAAEAMQISPEKIRKAVREGKLKSHRNGTQTRVLVSDLESYVRNHWKEVPHGKS